MDLRLECRGIPGFVISLYYSMILLKDAAEIVNRVYRFHEQKVERRKKRKARKEHEGAIVDDWMAKERAKEEADEKVKRERVNIEQRYGDAWMAKGREEAMHVQHGGHPVGSGVEH